MKIIKIRAVIFCAIIDTLKSAPRDTNHHHHNHHHHHHLHTDGGDKRQCSRNKRHPYTLRYARTSEFPTESRAVHFRRRPCKFVGENSFNRGSTSKNRSDNSRYTHTSIHINTHLRERERICVFFLVALTHRRRRNVASRRKEQRTTPPPQQKVLRFRFRLRYAAKV